MASQLATVVGCYISHLLVIVACASGHASDSNVRNELEVDVELIDVPTTLTLAVQACRTIERNSPDVTFGRLAVSDSELGVDVIDFDECYCYLFTVLYCSLVLHAGPF